MSATSITSNAALTITPATGTQNGQMNTPGGSAMYADQRQVLAVVEFTSRSHCRKHVLLNSVPDLCHQGFDHDQLTQTSKLERHLCELPVILALFEGEAEILARGAVAKARQFAALAQLRYINAEL